MDTRFPSKDAFCNVLLQMHGAENVMKLTEQSNYYQA